MWLLRSLVTEPPGRRRMFALYFLNKIYHPHRLPCSRLFRNFRTSSPLLVPPFLLLFPAIPPSSYAFLNKGNIRLLCAVCSHFPGFCWPSPSSSVQGRN